MLLAWFLLFVLLAAVSGFLGFRQLSSAAGVIARFLFALFVIVAIIFLVQWAISGFPS